MRFIGFLSILGMVIYYRYIIGIKSELMGFIKRFLLRQKMQVQIKFSFIEFSETFLLPAMEN